MLYGILNTEKIEHLVISKKKKKQNFQNQNG